MFNDSDQPQHATLTLDASRLRLWADRRELEDVLSGTPLPLRTGDGLAAVEVDLPPGDVRVLRLG